VCPRALWSVLGVLLPIALAAPSGAYAGERVTPQDRAATRAYLEAQYTYDQSLLATAPASTEALQALAGSLGSECPGVLVGAPHPTLALFESHPSGPRSSRQKGEELRESRQWSELQGELGFAIGLAEAEPNRQAALAYARTVRSLRWSDAAVTAFEHVNAIEPEFDARARPPELCADMRAWVASGYRTLSTATKALTREQAALIRPLVRVVRELGFSYPVDPLRSYEGPRERVLAGKIGALERKRLGGAKSFFEITTALEVRLGITSQAETEAEERPAKGSVEIAHGNTAARTSYTVWVEPRKSGPRARCPLSLSVYETETGGGIFGALETGGGGSSACLSRSRPEPPRVQCENGNLTIEAQTLTRARRVRLRLSDGRQVSSPVAYVPARLGGPAGFYYQAVRGPSPIPVSLAELDAHGRVLRTVKLPRIGKCRKPAPVRPSVRTIATGTLPQGPGFSILGERALFAENHLRLRTELGAGAEAGGLLGGAGSIPAVEGLTPKPGPFALELTTGCQPHEYAILYGVLAAARDTVLARTASGLRPFRRVGIPASFHAHGVVAYLALPALPTEVIVRSPKGKTVFARKLAHQSREARETCEGEAEGPA
jgi:hypothetical protein